MKREKLETFNDAVIAIIITLMVLDIKLPELNKNNLFALMQHIAVYALSFVVLGITWLNQQTIFKDVENVNSKVIWADLALLFFLSLIPLPTQALGEHFFQEESHLFYGIIATITSVFYSLLHMSINQMKTESDKKLKPLNSKNNWSAVGLYALSIPLSFISIYLSTAIFIFIPIGYFIRAAKKTK